MFQGFSHGNITNSEGKTQNNKKNIKFLIKEMFIIKL